MRDFTDEGGRRWEVVIGRESWGAFYTLFVPQGPAAGRSPRRTMVEATSQMEAERALTGWSEAELAELFRTSRVGDEEN